MRHPFGAVGASTFLLAAITAFYDRERAHGGDFFIYPDYFLFHVGGPLGDHSMLDVWPSHKEVVVPYELQLLSRAEFDALPPGEDMFVHSYGGRRWLYPPPARWVNHADDPSCCQDFDSACDVALRDITALIARAPPLPVPPATPPAAAPSWPSAGRSRDARPALAEA